MYNAVSLGDKAEILVSEHFKSMEIILMIDEG